MSYIGLSSTISIATTFFVFNTCSKTDLKKFTEKPKGLGALTPGACAEVKPSRSILTYK